MFSFTVSFSGGFCVSMFGLFMYFYPSLLSVLEPERRINLAYMSVMEGGTEN